MELSVIIVSYNVRHYLKQCLKSVIRSAEGLDAEIIVIDNNSSDGSDAMVSEDFQGVKLIANSHNSGFSAACNQGIRASCGEFILLLNPDTFIEESTFADCIRFMHGRPDAGALGVKLISGNGKLLPESKRALPTPSTAFFKMSGLGWLFPRSGLLNRYYLGHLDSSETAEAEVLTGAFMMIRRSILEKTGMLDEQFFMYGEDIDLSYRILKSGFKNYYFPGVRIVHYKGESTKKDDVRYLVHFYRAMLIFIGKHFSNAHIPKYFNPLHIAVISLGAASIIKNLFKRCLRPAGNLLRNINPFKGDSNILIVCIPDDVKKISEIIESRKGRYEKPEIINTFEGETPRENRVILKEIIQHTGIRRTDEIIISSGGLTASRIIDIMQEISSLNIPVRIAYPDDNIIIGSNSITLSGN